MNKALTYILKAFVFACKVECCMSMADIVMGCGKKYKTKLRNANPSNYYEMIGVIMGTNMLDSTKQEIIETLERAETVEYYQAVNVILKSNMLDSTKVEIIKKLSE